MPGAQLLVLVLLGQTADSQLDPTALVEKMGSASYAEREAAKSLESLGGKALPALRSALKSKDAEVRLRARSMINKIEGNLLVQGTPVRLDFKDATLDDIFKSLSKQAGFNISLASRGPMNLGMTKERISLQDSNPVPFWKAIDRVFEAAHLGYQVQQGYQQGMMPGQTGRRPDLVLVPQPDLASQPRSDHGAFQVSLTMLSFQSHVSFTASSRMYAQFRGANGASTKVAMKAARSPVEKSRAGAKGSSSRPDAEKAGNDPARTIQFTANLQILPEPRMTMSQAGAVELLEAVDDRGNSLLPTSKGVEMPFGNMGFAAPGMFAVNSTVQLHRPETPGGLIKKLRGTVEVSVSARQPDPLVIPLEGAAGKTFQNDALHVIVNAIDLDQAPRQNVIELTIEEIDQLFPEQPGNGMGPGARNMAIAMGGTGGENPQSPIQLINTGGQNMFFQLMFDRDSGRLKLRVHQMPQMGEMKEIRVSNIIRARTKIPFEFQDLPMP
ncbi:MAG: hypothetical protein ACHRXM_15005 [Isosphaerales bacterium]